MPQYCKDCIHNIVCKYTDKIEKWENSFKGRGTSNDWHSTPIIINCEAKLYDSTATNSRALEIAAK